jgi:hypothetical protein
MDWIERLNRFEDHLQKRVSQGWVIMTPYYKDSAELSLNGEILAAEIDYDGKITERKKKPRRR